MRSVSDLISQSKKQPEAANGAIVLTAFVIFVITVLGIPAGLVWAANSIGGF